MFACLIRAANRVLDGIEEFGYALAGLPTVHNLEDMVSYRDHEAEEYRGAIDWDHPDDYPMGEGDEDHDDYDGPNTDEWDMDDYYEGHYDEEDYV